MSVRFPAIVALVVLAAAPAVVQAADAGPASGFAVVELFTSEGCSSCPPADDALSRISRDAAMSQLPLYVLEWHVDYWDYLGWRDPFGSSQATLRERAYARVLGTDVYTPEAIVNGSVIPDWAGDENEVFSIARTFVSARLPGRVSLVLSASAAGNKVLVHAEAAGTPQGTALLVALVEDGLSSTPDAGENAGRKLTHSSVVRSAVSRPAAGGDFVLDLPVGTDIGRSSIVALVQETATMRITFAARAEIRTIGRLSGRVVDPTGVGIASVRIQVCSSELCIPATTDAMGYFMLEKVPPGSYTIVLNDELAPAARFTMAGHQAVSVGPLTMLASGPS